jgi:hypothetical protein
MNGGNETRRPSQIRAAEELLEQFQALQRGDPVDFENIRAAKWLKNELIDFLLLLGTDYQEFRRSIEMMSFLRYENRMGLPLDFLAAAGELKDLCCGRIDANEVYRAERILIHVIELLGADTTKEPPSADNVSETKTGPKRRDHEQVATIVQQYNNDWKLHLSEICGELDALNMPVPTRWKQWMKDNDSPMGPDSWQKALAIDRPNVVKSIDNSLKETKKSRR